MKRFIGLRNIVTHKDHWKRLLFYEIDGHDDYNLHRLIKLLYKMPISWVLYKTLNGYHSVGLTPISATEEGCWHDIIQRIVPEYFSGQTLRLSLKENEKQELIDYTFWYPYLERLASIYIKRFNIPGSEIPKYGEPPVYTCVFEKYWTDKIQ